tara:strand:+ start:230 stop:487 length:258 start_codon:yes stop_codon:yes gene_type:complete
MENNNILSMMSMVSDKIESKNPELKGMVNALLSGKINDAKSIEKFLISKSPSKAKEIRKSLKDSDFKSKLDKLKDIQSQANNIFG